MDEYGASADAALESDEATDATEDLGDGTARIPDIDGSVQSSDR